MSTERPERGEHRPRRGPVVISSLTGKPIHWDPDAGTTGEAGVSGGAGSPRAARSASGRRRPILPDRLDEDQPEPGADESNDARIAGDVPPHWGRGR